MEYKKQAVDLTDLAIGIVILGIVVAIGVNILTITRDARLTDLNVITTSNETTPATDGGDKLANSWFKAIKYVTNASGGESIASTNYTTSTSVGGTGTVTFLGTSEYNGTNVNVSYNWYNTSRADFALANNASVGIAEYGNWFKIIVIVGVAAVVLSLIFMAFGRRSGSAEAGISY